VWAVPNAIQHIAFLFKAFIFYRYKLKKQRAVANPHIPNKKPLHSNHHHHFAYASIKNVGSYINIMWHYSTAFSPAYASIQPHSQSYNNIMLSIQHHSCPYQSRAVFSPTAPTQKPNSPPPFQRSEKK
jgi:hypothetical protein